MKQPTLHDTGIPVYEKKAAPAYPIVYTLPVVHERKTTIKKFFLILLLLLAGSILFSQRTFAQDYRFALGLRLSNDIPTISNSVSGKYFVTDLNAIEGIVSFGSRFGIGALLELHRPFATPGLSWYFGGGAYVGWEDHDTYLGPTGVLGLDYKFANVPVNLSLDWKPELDIIPRINFVSEAFAVAIRFVIK